MLDKSLINHLKRVDPDRYRSALLADRQGRHDLLALYAFHSELAKVPEFVSEPMIGSVRYQWWRDVVEEIYTQENVRSHEISTILALLVKRKQLPRYWIDLLINARERDLDPTPFADLDMAIDYALQTSGSLVQLAVFCLEDHERQDIISRLGTVWGLTGLLRSWKFYHGTILSNLDFNETLETTEILYREIMDQKVRAEILPAIAYVALVPEFLRQMRRPDYEPRAMIPNYTPIRKQLCLMKTVLHGKFNW